MNVVHKYPLLHILRVICLLAVLGGCSNIGSKQNRPVVLDGQIDVRGQTDSIELTGHWAFWSSQFVDPVMGPDNFNRFEQFPSSWSAYKPNPLAAQGYGTYAVTITGLDPTVVYGFHFPAYSCAVRYFANGQEIYSQGTPADNKKAERPTWDSNVVPLPFIGVRTVTLVLHLSNFNDRFPASTIPVMFGSFENLNVTSAYQRLLMIIPFGAILAMGAYFMALFVFHREDYSCFWLGLLCLVFALRIICYDEFILQDILPIVSASLVFRLGYLTFALAAAGFCGFVRAQYPDIAKKAVIIPLTTICLVYGACVMFAPVAFFTALLEPFQIFSILAAGYVLYVVFRAAITGKEGALLFVAGFVIFILNVIRDILIANRMIDGVFLAHYGILGIIVAMALIIVRQFSKAFNHEEALTENLEKINISLVRFVPNEFFRFLGKKAITDICLGDNILKEMCVMFIHLGIDIPLTGTASRLNMLEMFNNTLLQVNPVIQKYNGFVDKYLNEGVMALFPDDSCNAVLCALEIQAALDAYSAGREAQNLPRILFAAGIHRGSLMLGTIGEDERMDSTVISDVVNIASRLKNFAVSKKIQVVISEDVAIPLGGPQPCACSLIHYGEVRLRGKDQPVSVFEVRPV